MRIRTLTDHLEKIAPLSYQESYDNAGLITGDPSWEIKGVLTTLDATEAVIEEAVERGCNVVVAHHPIVFKGLKKITGANYVERTVIKAIKADVDIYAIHTNPDNVLARGVNGKIAERLGLQNIRILAPKRLTYASKIQVDEKQKKQLQAALENERGINIAATLPAYGRDGSSNGLFQVELVYEQARQGRLRSLVREFSPDQPFSSVRIDDKSEEIGSGVFGLLPQALPATDFLHFLKEKMKAGCIRHTELVRPSIRKIAVCGGAGGFLLSAAIGQDADIFITADYKYHEFFDADGKIIIADIGHYESEQFTIDLLHEIISETFSTFAVYKTRVNTNPVNYL